MTTAHGAEVATLPANWMPGGSTNRPSSAGTPQDPRNLPSVFKAFLRKAGLPDIRFHDLRHTAASLMLQQGIHPKVVEERLGHSKISLTLDIKSHVLPSLQDEAAAKLDALLCRAAPIHASMVLEHRTRSSKVDLRSGYHFARFLMLVALQPEAGARGVYSRRAPMAHPHSAGRINPPCRIGGITSWEAWAVLRLGSQ